MAVQQAGEKTFRSGRPARGYAARLSRGGQSNKGACGGPPERARPSLAKLGFAVWVGYAKLSSGMRQITDSGRMRDICAFENQSRTAETLDQLSAMIDALIRQIEFRWFMLVHYVDLSRYGKQALLMTTDPPTWLDEILEEKLYIDGPLQAACASSVSGFCWGRLGEVITPTARQRSIRDRGCAHGMVDGFTMLTRMHGEPDAMFSVARRKDSIITSEEILTARLIGTIAFEQARVLHGTDQPAVRTTSLSPRQIDCIELVARGKSDWGIGQILGLSRDTVHEYVEAARCRYGVRRRTQLVLTAVRDGYLSVDALS